MHYFQRIKDRKGITLVEALVASAIGLSLVGAILMTTNLTTGTMQQTAALGDNEAQLAALITTMVRMGSMAAGTASTPGCTAPNATTLQCNTALGGLTKTVRYTLNGTTVEYQTLNSGTWTTTVRYPDISQFVVCDEAAMIAVPASCSTGGACTLPTGACSITPYNISTAYGAVGAMHQGRFFRVYVQSDINVDTKTISGRANAFGSTRGQASIFVRNPSPWPSVSFVPGNPA